MQINNYFNPKRLYLLIKKDFYTQYKTYLIALGAIFSILFIINIASVTSHKAWNFHSVFYPLTLLIGGYIFTSLSFNELDSEKSLIFYLTLPVSNLEKFISKLLISSIGYVIVSLALYFIFSAVSFLICTLIFGYAHRIFNPFNAVIFKSIYLYIVTQSVYLLGAVVFRGSAFIKTVLSAFVIIILYNIIMAVITYFLYLIISQKGHLYFPYEIINNVISGNNPFTLNAGSVYKTIGICISVFFRFIFAPLLWVIAFFKLKESEI